MGMRDIDWLQDSTNKGCAFDDALKVKSLIACGVSGMTWQSPG
jgi:hypothetical protein